MERNTIGLLALQEQVRQALEDTFYETVWLQAEISELKQNPSGHCYLTLVEKDPRSNALLAKAPAIVWASTWRMVKPYFESQTGRALAPGLSVLIRVQVNYSALYGLSLIVYDIDPSFTVGELELARQRTIVRLQEEGMFGMNAALPLPVLPRRLAVISSATAAGYRDFQRHLSENEYGFQFRTTLFPAVMQGADAPASIITALDAVAAEAEAYDAVMILRGGGGAMDLVCFDDYELAVNVAQFPLPVLTAIGHDHDFHVIDMVAHTHVKTPTALADWLIERFAGEDWQVDLLLQRLHLAVRAKAEAQRGVLESMRLRISNAVAVRHGDALHALDLLQQRLDAVNPQRALDRGFLIALKNGRRAASASVFAPGDRLTLLFRDGTVEAEVQTMYAAPSPSGRMSEPSGIGSE
jgi:exodeoxyribonuclease VII large subunit